jgi:hypothetical protein
VCANQSSRPPVLVVAVTMVQRLAAVLRSELPLGSKHASQCPFGYRVCKDTVLLVGEHIRRRKGAGQRV